MKKVNNIRKVTGVPGRWLGVVTAVAGSLALVACDVDKTEEGEMPEVNVEGGKMPEYEVRGPDIDVGTKTKEIEVPTVDIDFPEEEENEPPAADAPPVPDERRN